jgi:hypothetical protein
VDEHFRDIIDVALRGVLTSREEPRWNEDSIERLASMAKEASHWTDQENADTGDG